jgi:tol-pal system protein YbgF
MMRNVNFGVRLWSARLGAAGRLLLGHAAAVVIALGVIGTTPALAANREHQQLMADIRMLQEQTQQLQSSIGALTDALKVMSTRMDEQANLQRKLFADQKLLVDNLTGEVRIVREKLDDTNVRLSSLSQEVEALRQQPVAAPQPTMPPSTDGAQPPGTVPAPGSDPGAVQPSAAGGPPPAAPAAGPGVGMSPTRLYEIAQADYAGGQWALAINGFETYLRTFPKTEKADDAQFFIGEAYQLDGKFKDAITSYDKVIADYPSGDRVPDAYYKRGLAYSRLAQNDKARESFEAVIKNFPNSEAARLAKQLLDRLGRGSREQ